MNTNTIGFVGAGRIVRVLLNGWKSAGVEMPGIVAADNDPAVLERLPQSHRYVLTDNVAKAAEQGIVFIALHPPCITSVLGEIRAAIKATAIVVSLAPKFTIAQLSTLLGGFDRIVRVIPNVPALVGHGYNPVAFGTELTAEDRSVLTNLFTPLGAFPEVSESMLETYAVITAMGPTYFWPQCDELVNLAESFGLSKTAALEAVAQMVAGTASALANSGLTASELLSLIPVQPLSESEAAIREAYRAKLPGLLEKIRPVTN